MGMRGVCGTKTSPCLSVCVFVGEKVLCESGRVRTEKGKESGERKKNQLLV